MSVYSLENGFTKQQRFERPPWVVVADAEGRLLVELSVLLATWPQSEERLCELTGFNWQHPEVARAELVRLIMGDLSALPLTPFYIYRPPLMLLLESTRSPIAPKSPVSPVCQWSDALVCYNRVITRIVKSPNVLTDEQRNTLYIKWRDRQRKTCEDARVQLRTGKTATEWAEITASLLFNLLHQTEYLVLALFSLQEYYHLLQAPSHLPSESELSPEQQATLLADTASFHELRLPIKNEDSLEITDRSSLRGIPLAGLRLLRESLE